MQQSVMVEWVDPSTLKAHPENVAIYGEDGFDDLIPSIQELGVIQALYVTRKERRIVSGHRRWAAAKACQKQVPVIWVTYENEIDELEAILEFNRYRTKNGEQFHREAQKHLWIESERAKGRQGERTDLKPNIVQTFAPSDKPDAMASKTRTIVAAKIGLGSGEQLRKLEYVAAKTPDVLKDIKPNGKTVNQAYQQARRQEVHQAIAATPQWPNGKYRVIYADPPWKYGNSMPTGFVEQADHYPLMTIPEICALPVKSLALDNAVLFLWVTSPILEESFQVIHEWGFQYKSSFVWDKVKHVMGHYNSVRHEFLLIGVRGSCQPDVNELFDSVLTIERTEHSSKPEDFRHIIDTIYPYGPRIELFRRGSKPEGWEIYGNQAVAISPIP